MVQRLRRRWLHLVLPMTNDRPQPDHLGLVSSPARMDGSTHCWWNQATGWANWFNVSGGAAALDRASMSSPAIPNHLDLFVTGTDRRIYSTWWNQATGWAGWFNVSGGDAATLGSPIDVVAPYPGHLGPVRDRDRRADLFGVVASGGNHSDSCQGAGCADLVHAVSRWNRRCRTSSRVEASTW